MQMWKNDRVLIQELATMVYRLVLALGLLALGVHVGREVARTRPVRHALKQARPARTPRLTLTPRSYKVSVH
jgi:hypothetical protein